MVGVGKVCVCNGLGWNDAMLSVDYHTLNILVRELYGQEIINYYKAVFKTLLECYCVTRNKPIRCSVGKIKYNQQR